MRPAKGGLFNVNVTETIIFILYLVFMLSIGIYFFLKNKNADEKVFFLGGRQMGPWVSALSAGASDMSAWVLMGLPASVYALGLGQIWIGVGLAIGYAIAWIIEAPRLRRFSIVANDSITIPQYLTNRFLSKSYVLQIACALIFLFAYTIYSASSIKACGTLFNTVIGMDATQAMYLAAVIIIGYTFLGGFSAVCWTDFFQGLLMLGALFLVPVIAASKLGDISAMNAQIVGETPGYFHAFNNWKDVVSGFGWGLGYFGMPHIIIRFMSVESQKSIRKSAAIGITWTTLIIFFSVIVGIIGRLYLGYDQATEANSLVFIRMVRMLFPAVLSGLLLSAILAAAMSTADSQLLSAASAFANDVYKPIIRKGQTTDKEMLWSSRIIVAVIAIVALVIASNPNAGSIMSLVSNAWGVFGAAFGPAIMLSLFWKKFTYQGAAAGIIVGAAVDILWLTFLAGTGIYEIVPGFIIGGIVAILVSKLGPASTAETEKLFDRAVAYDE